MKGDDVITALKRKLRLSTYSALAKKLGVTVQAIHNWRNRSSVTARQIASLVNAALKSGGQSLAVNSIRPIVEFFPLEKSKSKRGTKHELFKVGDKYPYRNGVKDELKNQHGIYIFFDSRGQAIYVGKARHQKLWNEMNNAFNRNRGEVQKIKRVHHPKRNVVYKTSEEKSRRIRDDFVPLHDLAAYFSAYEITDSLINKMEAMLVRSFANNILNIRMEQFQTKKSSN